MRLRLDLRSDHHQILLLNCMYQGREHVPAASMCSDIPHAHSQFSSRGLLVALLLIGVSRARSGCSGRGMRHDKTSCTCKRGSCAWRAGCLLHAASLPRLWHGRQLPGVAWYACIASAIWWRWSSTLRHGLSSVPLVHGISCTACALAGSSRSSHRIAEPHCLCADVSMFALQSRRLRAGASLDWFC